MIPTPTYLRNTEAVLEAFGYWPSFHDARVVHFRYSDAGPGTVDLTLHASEMTSEVDGRGYFRLTKHHLVQFAFHGLSEVDLERFLADNILYELRFSSPEDFATSAKFRVDLESAMGSELNGSFSARTGEVGEVRPCNPDGEELGTTS